MNHHIDNARRIGRPAPGRKRPIIEVSLLRQKDKFAIFSAKAELKENKELEDVYINAAITPKEQKNHKLLITYMQRENNE